MFMQQCLLILLIHQHVVWHGSWATRVTAKASAAPTDQSSPTTTATATTLLVSASEATLLTTKISPDLSAAEIQRQWRRQRKQRQKQRQRQLFIRDNEIQPLPLSLASASASSSFTAGGAEILLPATPTDTKPSTANANVKNRYEIVSVRVNCTRELLEMRIELNRNFRGLLYAKDFPLECRARGNVHRNVTLRLPTSGCGVRSEPRPDGTLELSVHVMLQMEEKLRQSSDILRTIRCKLPLNALGMTLMPSLRAGNKLWKSFRNGRMRYLSANKDAAHIFSSQESMPEQDSVPMLATTESATAPSTTPTTMTISSSTATPRVRIWLELGGPDGSGAVEVGQATTLTVRAIVPGTMGVRVVDCAALDGLGESTQQLLDERGCPIDEQVMPALHSHFKHAEEGWSKHHEDDPIEKTFTATFPAFKFPDRERLHVSCGVQLCKGQCPDINCRSTESLVLSNDEHLARIEVFNSLAVTAPQIEVDRRYNITGEEYPYVRSLHSEGTLCLSVSKLALSFCVLGLIFLAAVIVTICSMIRSRDHTGNRCSSTSTHTRGGINRPEICTSMFSSSSESGHSARFGSKLFIPYYPNTLPYGRVY